MTVQNHMHMDISVGGGAEAAPALKWKVRNDGWMPVPEIVADFRRTLRGKLKRHLLRDEAGEILRFMDYKYIVRVSDYWGKTKAERYQFLIENHGKTVYVVDNQHIGDGFSHTPYLRTMVLTSIGDIKNINVQIDPLYVSIELKDFDTWQGT